MNLKSQKHIAVIDTETNFYDEVISIGIVIANTDSFEAVDKLYYIIDPECRKPSMFGDVLKHKRSPIDAVLSRNNAIIKSDRFLSDYGIKSIFAYNANFDKNHLPELNHYNWYDIMRIAAYKQFNQCIPNCCECCKTGKMKSGYSAENIYKMVSGNDRYNEIHNALTDAEDELEIMKYLAQPIETYEIAQIK